MPIRDVAIVGGGPAGAMCGEQLAAAGLRVTLIDEHLAWEKPCGGGLTYKAVERYPFLLEGPQPKRLVRKAELIAGRERALLELDQPVVIYSRRVLNGVLLERARAAGCRLVRSHVARVKTERAEVRLQAGGEEFAADFVVLAAGARNSLLPGTPPLAPSDLEHTVGYFVPLDGTADEQQETLKLKFPERLGGYLWSFPRHNHLSVGVCAPIARASGRGLKQQVLDFIRAEGLRADGAAGEDAAGEFFSHVLPSPGVSTLRHRPVMGRNWALAGDAAAWVDPLTGEGLYYAIRSGHLLGQAIARGRPEEYVERVRREFTCELEVAVRAARRFFEGSILGGPVARRMVQFIRCSPTIQRIASDLVSGAQNYSTLKRRLLGRASMVFAEIIAGLTRRRVRITPLE
jgi:geranylgeranyl reductase family protein